MHAYTCSLAIVQLRFALHIWFVWMSIVAMILLNVKRKTRIIEFRLRTPQFIGLNRNNDKQLFSTFVCAWKSHNIRSFFCRLSFPILIQYCICFPTGSAFHHARCAPQKLFHTTTVALLKWRLIVGLYHILLYFTATDFIHTQKKNCFSCKIGSHYSRFCAPRFFWRNFTLYSQWNRSKNYELCAIWKVTQLQLHNAMGSWMSANVIAKWKKWRHLGFIDFKNKSCTITCNAILMRITIDVDVFKCSIAIHPLKWYYRFFWCIFKIFIFTTFFSQSTQTASLLHRLTLHCDKLFTV